MSNRTGRFHYALLVTRYAAGRRKTHHRASKRRLMRILPKDLGLAWHVRFVQARDSAEKAGAEPPKPRLGFLGRLWARGRGLDERSAAAVVPAARNTIGTSIGMVAGPSLAFLVMSSGILF